MKEGKVVYFKWHQIIQCKDDDRYYIYNAECHFLDVTDTLNSAKEKILKTFNYLDKKDLEHDGVEILIYYVNDFTVYLSLKEEVFKTFKFFKQYNYEQITTQINIWSKYIHNERGPAYSIVESKNYSYYWHGKEFPKEQWEKIIRDRNFKNSLNSILDEELS